MALESSYVKRLDEAGGKELATKRDTISNQHHQSVVLADENGSQSGTPDNPMSVLIKSNPVVSQMLSNGVVSAFSGTFSRTINNRHFTIEALNKEGGTPTDLYHFGDGGLALNAGLADLSKVAVRTRFSPPDIVGLGGVFGFSIRLTDVATPVSGQVKRWGIGNTTDGLFIEYDGADEEVFLRAYKSGVETISVPGSNWTLPVIYSAPTGRLKEGIQHWLIQFDWVSSRVVIWLDGEQVQDYRLSGTATSTLTRNKTGRIAVEVENEDTLADGNLLHLYAIHSLVHTSNGLKLSGMNRRTASVQDVPVPATVLGVLMNLVNDPFRVIGGTKVPNNRIARVRKITLSHGSSATGSDESGYGCHFRIMKNCYATGGFRIDDEKPKDPGDCWMGLTTAAGAIRATIGSNAAQLSGYEADDLVRYKITALGAYGETSPGVDGANTADYVTEQVDVADPPQEVVVTLQVPIANALAYRIYRQINGGSYELIAEADPITVSQDGFVDIGYNALSPTTVPVTDTAEGDSFLKAYFFSSGELGHLAAAQSIDSVFLASNTRVIEYADGELTLSPGETLVVYLNKNTKASLVGCSVSWDEEGDI